MQLLRLHKKYGKPENVPSLSSTAESNEKTNPAVVELKQLVEGTLEDLDLYPDKAKIGRQKDYVAALQRLRRKYADISQEAFLVFQ